MRKKIWNQAGLSVNKEKETRYRAKCKIKSPAPEADFMNVGVRRLSDEGRLDNSCYVPEEIPGTSPGLVVVAGVGPFMGSRSAQLPFSASFSFPLSSVPDKRSILMA